MIELRIVVVDDEPLAVRRLQRQLDSLQGYTCVGAAGNADMAQQLINTLKPDVVLLDIDMPGISGLQLIGKMRSQQSAAMPSIILTTAHEQHALQAFELGVRDYLLKPIKKQRLQTALKRLQQQVGNDNPQQRLKVRHAGEQLWIDLTSISCCMADDKYVRIYHDAGDVLSDYTLVQIEQKFSDYFVRVHRNALVARGRILGLQTQSGKARVKLQGCSIQPELSRRHRKSLQEL